MSDLESTLDRIEDCVASHPGNMRCFRLECRIDEMHNTYWTAYAVGRNGKHFTNSGADDSLAKAVDQFFKREAK